MNSNNKKKQNKAQNLEQAMDKTSAQSNVSAQKDGFRYDYTDSSDLNSDDMN